MSGAWPTLSVAACSWQLAGLERRTLALAYWAPNQCCRSLAGAWCAFEQPLPRSLVLRCRVHRAHLLGAVTILLPGAQASDDFTSQWFHLNWGFSKDA
jgi:hypothetical protein